MSGTIDKKLADLGVTLPTPIAPLAAYVPYVRSGRIVVVSGQLPAADGKLLATGRLGDGVTVEQGKQAARQCLVNVLAQLKAACGGDLDRVVRVVRLGGFVSSGPGFTEHHLVMNGASELAAQVFGDAGQHARSTIGVSGLPMDAAVEVEGMFEVEMDEALSPSQAVEGGVF